MSYNSIFAAPVARGDESPARRTANERNSTTRAYIPLDATQSDCVGAGRFGVRIKASAAK